MYAGKCAPSDRHSSPLWSYTNISDISFGNINQLLIAQSLSNALQDHSAQEVYCTVYVSKYRKYFMFLLFVKFILSCFMFLTRPHHRWNSQNTWKQIRWTAVYKYELVTIHLQLVMRMARMCGCTCIEIKRLHKSWSIHLLCTVWCNVDVDVWLLKNLCVYHACAYWSTIMNCFFFWGEGAYPIPSRWTWWIYFSRLECPKNNFQCCVKNWWELWLFDKCRYLTTVLVSS